MGVEPAIMIRNITRVNVNGYNYSYRNHIVKQIKKNQEQWKRKVNYNQRWHIESFFSAFKRIFGEYIVSKTLNYIVKELVFKIFFMNMLTKV